MTKTNKTNKAHCNGCGGSCTSCSSIFDANVAGGKCSSIDANAYAQHTGEKETLDYGFYSNILKKPFERLDDLKKAEYVYNEEQKAKEEKAAAKKADAQKVEEAFKALNAARKAYKENLSQLTTEYSEALTDLKKAYDLGKKDITDKLAEAEDAYSKALKDFTDAHPEGYHITLKDGDFETTISGKGNLESDKSADVYSDIFRLIFGI